MLSPKRTQLEPAGKELGEVLCVPTASNQILIRKKVTGKSVEGFSHVVRNYRVLVLNNSIQVSFSFYLFIFLIRFYCIN